MSEIPELGAVLFLYRPRMGVREVHELSAVQRFLVVLRRDDVQRYRRLIVGRKRLPDPASNEREWAFVAEVTDDPNDLGAALGEEPPARLAGEGRYAIVVHDGHTHLEYVLERPPEPGEVQRALNVRSEASYVVAVRNPDAPAPPGAGLPEHRRADYPPHLRERFGTRRFIPADPPELLDYPGAELVLIGAGAGLTTPKRTQPPRSPPPGC